MYHSDEKASLLYCIYPVHEEQLDLGLSTFVDDIGKVSCCDECNHKQLISRVHDSAIALQECLQKRL